MEEDRSLQSVWFVAPRRERSSSAYFFQLSVVKSWFTLCKHAITFKSCIFVR